jgi:hypothetical protein
MTFDTIGSNFDTIMAIYQGTSINTLNLLGLNDDVNPARNSRMKTSRVSFNAFPNQTYYIMVDGKNGVQGSILLNWDDSFAPVNDFLTSPIFFTELQAGCVDSVTIETSGTTKGAAKEPGSTGPEPNHAGQIGKRSVWYRLTLPENSGCADMVIRTIRIKVTATTPGFDPVVAVYTGSQTDVSGLTSVAFQDDITPGSNTNVDMSFLAGPGTYLIAVDGKFCSSGNFDLTIENSATSAFGPAAP